MTAPGTLGHELARMFAPPGACLWGQLCMYVCTGMANSPCSWCAGNISPPRLPPVDRRHLLPGHLLHGCTVAGAGVPYCACTGTGGRCGRAALCAHGRAMPVTRLRARRLSRADALGSLTRPAAGALATFAPPACRRWTVVTCSRAICSTVAPLQVLACRVVRARARHACDAFASPPSEPC